MACGLRTTHWNAFIFWIPKTEMICAFLWCWRRLKRQTASLPEMNIYNQAQVGLGISWAYVRQLCHSPMKSPQYRTFFKATVTVQHFALGLRNVSTAGWDTELATSAATRQGHRLHQRGHRKGGGEQQDKRRTQSLPAGAHSLSREGHSVCQ